MWGLVVHWMKLSFHAEWDGSSRRVWSRKVTWSTLRINKISLVPCWEFPKEEWAGIRESRGNRVGRTRIWTSMSDKTCKICLFCWSTTNKICWQAGCGCGSPRHGEPEIKSRVRMYLVWNIFYTYKGRCCGSSLMGKSKAQGRGPGWRYKFGGCQHLDESCETPWAL